MVLPAIARKSSKEWDHMSTTEAKRTDNGEIEDLDVIIVGAGFAGLYLLDRLRSMGMAVQVFEAGGGLGGVWYWNCYPGARVDSSGPIYQYSRDDLWRKWQFSELYPSWPASGSGSSARGRAACRWLKKLPAWRLISRSSSARPIWRYRCGRRSSTRTQFAA